MRMKSFCSKLQHPCFLEPDILLMHRKQRLHKPTSYSQLNLFLIVFETFLLNLLYVLFKVFQIRCVIINLITKFLSAIRML